MSEFKVVPIHTRKFELHKGDECVGYMDYHEGVGSLYMDYVFVEPEHRNQEIGKEIVRQGIFLAQSKKMKAKPICGYASTIMKRHNWPEELV